MYHMDHSINCNSFTLRHFYHKDDTFGKKACYIAIEETFLFKYLKSCEYSV